MMSDTYKLFPGFISLLTIIFVIAKIWGKLDWSWWLVFSPLWISGLIVVGIIIIVLIIWGLYQR